MRGEACASPLTCFMLGGTARVMKLFLLSICFLSVAAGASITCGGELSPGQTQQRKSQGGPVRNYASFVASLRASGITVEPEGEVDQPFFSVKGKVISLYSDHVQIFDYPNAVTADAEAALVSPDGRTVGTMKPHWLGPPHFYKKEKLIVLYLGDNEKVLKALGAVLGRQFAGK